MNSEKDSVITEEILGSSRKMVDSAGQKISIIEESQALKIADKLHCSLHRVHTEALRKGIYPYRYIRNRRTISIEDQLKLSESQVAIAGAGGLGGQVILMLARMGVGHLIVVDYDIFDETNLNRQALSNRDTLGHSKSEEAASLIGSVNPGVVVTSHKLKIDSSNSIKILSGSDVIVDALDNIPDRFALEDAAREIGAPLVHGAVAGFDGQLTTIFPDDPGLRSLYGKGHKGKRSPKGIEAILGVPAPAPAVVATLQAMEVIKIILSRGTPFRNVMVYVDLETGQIRRLILKNGDFSQE